MRRRFILSAIIAISASLLVVGCGGNRADQNELQQQNIDGTFDRAVDPRNNGMAEGNPGAYNNGVGNRNRLNNNPNNGMNNAAGQRDEFEIAEEAAEKVTELDFVRSAYVLKTADNAYVAALLENEGELSRHMEDQVAQAVRQIDGSIRHVYVSTNPNFIDRVDAYIDDIRGGRPVEGFVEEFTEMIDRIFPNAN